MPAAEVTVIVPIKDAVEVVPSLVERLRSLEGSPEIIVIDDDSTDGTAQALRQQMVGHATMKLIQGPGRGVAAARNAAVEAASGEYLWFADCDDEWEPDIVERLYRVALDSSADVVLCNAAKEVVGTTHADLIEDAPTADVTDGPTLLRSILRGEVQGHLWNKLIRRSCLAQPAFPSTRAHSDLGGVLLCLSQVDRVAQLPATLYRYHVHAGSILNSTSYRWEDLPDCLLTAKAVASRLGLDQEDEDLRAFACTHVALPLLHESVRRRDALAPAELVAVQRTCASLYGWRDLGCLRRRGHSAGAAELALLRLSPGIYTRLYAAYRAKRWSGLDHL